MISLRFECTGRWPVHFFRKTGRAAAVLLAAAPVPAIAAANVAVAQAQQPPVAGQGIADFYRLRNNYPLWLTPRSGDAAQQLITLLSTANLDGLYPDKYHVADLQKAVDAARDGKRKAV